jgi:hypothetical protein
MQSALPLGDFEFRNFNQSRMFSLPERSVW